MVEPSVRRATSYDVARLAGVSQSAVSRAFREGSSVSVETRRKVEEAARHLGYAPSNVARSLITQRSRMIGVVVTDLTTRNYPEVLFHLGQEIQETGNRMLVFTLPQDEATGALATDILAFHVDGVISGATLPDEMLELCARHRIPVVLYNRNPRGASAASVGCDTLAMSDLVAHLVRGGLKRAAFIGGPVDAAVTRLRLQAGQAALAEHGLVLESIRHSDYSYEGGRAAAGALLRERPGIDTVLCANDGLALGAIDACRFDLGLGVPEDVAVTGFDDIPQAAWPTYDLTTLRQPVQAMTRAAVRMLTEAIAGVDLGRERRLMPAELRIRHSTRPPRLRAAE